MDDLGVSQYRHLWKPPTLTLEMQPSWSLCFLQGAIIADHLNVKGLLQDTSAEAHLRFQNVQGQNGAERAG